jgi:predicted ribonuclease YlaK
MAEVYNLEISYVITDEPVDYVSETLDFEVEDDYTISEDFVGLNVEGQQISVLPVHKNFRKCLPFHPSDSDMDGQIILTVLAVGMIDKGLAIDGTVDCREVMSTTFDNVVLVTNDNGLAIRARERGLLTMRYGYQYPEPYTGRRDITVPKELFEEFYTGGYVSLETWTNYMPDEPELVANEFLVMTPENGEYPMGYDPSSNWDYCNIGRYEVREEAIVKLRYLRDFPVGVKNAGQAIYAEALMDPNVSAVVCTGPAGTGKTYMATVYGYSACRDGEFIGVTVVPCDCKNTHGYLPGDLDEKMDPDVQPMKNALRNYLLNEDSKYRKELSNLKKFGTGAEGRKKAKSQGGCDEEGDKKRSLKVKLADHVDLIWSNWFSNIPICFARGRDFAHELAIFDEFQDQTVSQADTLIKRLGQDGKIIITGDIKQIHAPYIDETSSGLTYASRILMDSPMVAQVSFTEEEVIRHPLVKTIALRQK